MKRSVIKGANEIIVHMYEWVNEAVQNPEQHFYLHNNFISLLYFLWSFKHFYRKISYTKMGMKIANGIHEHTIKIRWLCFRFVLVSFVSFSSCFVWLYWLRSSEFIRIECKNQAKYATKKRTSNFQKQNKKIHEWPLTQTHWVYQMHAEPLEKRFHHLLSIASNAQFKGIQWWEFIIPHFRDVLWFQFMK